MIDDLREVLDRLAQTEPDALADGSTVLALHEAAARLAAVTARATAAFDAARGHAAEHRTAAAWLAAKAHVAQDEAARTVRLGRACRSLPAAESAWLRGEITGRHVGLLAAARNDRTAERLAADEPMLVGQARRLTFKAFGRAVAYWEQLADPDGADANAARLRDRRRVHLSQTWRGSWRLDGDLDPIGGSVVANVLRAIEQELFEVDWAEARARVGPGVGVADLRRTAAQRRADALQEMATRAATAPRDGRRPAPLFTVLVGYETLHGRISELANRTVVAPGSLLPWLDQALVERVVFAPPNRVEVSETVRLYTGATRRAVEVRDLECYVDGCDEPAERCHVDHLEPWSTGGPTTQENGGMACRFHNLLRNRQPHGP